MSTSGRGQHTTDSLTNEEASITTSIVANEGGYPNTAATTLCNAESAPGDHVINVEVSVSEVEEHTITVERIEVSGFVYIFVLKTLGQRLVLVW